MTLWSSAPTVPWEVRDNLFDTVNLSVSPNAPPNGNNGYFNTTPMSGGSGNKIITPQYNQTAPDYQTGPLGAYYYPTSGSQLFSLVDAGYRTPAAAGLAQHTVRVDQFKESLTQPTPSGEVDIGFHFAAINTTTGLPVDSDGDGLADYLEDWNGNANASGSPDSGETDWNIYNSANALGSAPSLQVFTLLK
jgi:hypothetical protein